MMFSRCSALFSSSTLLVVAVSLTLLGCGGKSREDELFGDGSEEGGGGAAAVLDTATAGTVAGVVTFDGTPPAATVADMSADAVCASNAATADPAASQEVLVTGGKLGNVFVYVSKGLEGKKFAPMGAAPALDQQGCRYHPHVIGAMVGQPITVKNSDATLHNVHARPTKNKEFNFAQANAGMTKEVTFADEEVMIPIQCDVHGWMKSFVGVLPHPCFAVSDKDGAFTFKAPPGTYTVTAWHEVFGTQEQQVTVEQGKPAQINFTFKAS